MTETNAPAPAPATENPGPAIPPVGSDLKALCDTMRTELLAIEKAVRGIKDHPAVGFKCPEAFPGQHGEMIAQSMLAVRHIEDARMRLGKVLQYGRDGVSIFDRPEPQP